MSPRQIANLEAGKCRPSLDTARRIAGALGLDLQSVFPIVDFAHNDHEAATNGPVGKVGNGSAQHGV